MPQPEGWKLTPDVLSRLGIEGPQTGQTFTIQVRVDDSGSDGVTLSPVDGSAVETFEDEPDPAADAEAAPAPGDEPDPTLMAPELPPRPKPTRMTPGDALKGF